jgi:hypothetical protein
MGWGTTPGTPEANRRAHVESWTKGGEVRDFNEPFNKPSGGGTPAADPALSATRALPPAAMQSAPWSGGARTGGGGTASTVLTGGGVLTPDQAPRRKQLLGA